MAASNSNHEPSPLVFHPPDTQTQFARTISLPAEDFGRKPLPRREAFLSSIPWLQAVQAAVGREIVFALDEALLCQGRFAGRYNDARIWAYGPDALAEYSGIVLLGPCVDPAQVEHRWGLSFTNFQRTLADALALEPILDMQGITEALSDFYYTHGERIDGLSVPPQYQAAFETLLQDAVSYYDS